MNMKLSSERQQRVRKLRDAAIVVAKNLGEWTPAGPIKLLMVDPRHFGVQIVYRTSFNRLPPMPDDMKYFGALKKMPADLPFSIDVWTTKKVLNVEWDDKGAEHVACYRPGDWEFALLNGARSLTAVQSRG
jgi:hypothetical protein